MVMLRLLTLSDVKEIVAEKLNVNVKCVNVFDITDIKMYEDDIILEVDKEWGEK